MDCCCVSEPIILRRKKKCNCGGHIPLLNTLTETIKSYPECKCKQIYLGNHTSYNCKHITPEDKQATFDYCIKSNTHFYVHCPLIANLAKLNADKSIEIIEKELAVVNGLPASCVLHIGKVGTLENVANHINQLTNLRHSRYVPYHLLLEVAAGQGTELGTNWEELRKLYEGIDNSKVGLCLDTQHAFASGLCNFSNGESVVKMFDLAEEIFPKGINMVHLNDSKKEFGSKVDRHAPLKQGYIWYNQDESLIRLIELCKEKNIDMVSETSDMENDLRIIEQLNIN